MNGTRELPQDLFRHIEATMVLERMIPTVGFPQEVPQFPPNMFGTPVTGRVGFAVLQRPNDPPVLGSNQRQIGKRIGPVAGFQDARYQPELVDQVENAMIARSSGQQHVEREVDGSILRKRFGRDRFSLREREAIEPTIESLVEKVQ
jgi:hypothetical protein